jgi:histone-lysine N-methyltransferase SETMAR
MLKFYSAMINPEAKRDKHRSYGTFLHIDNARPHLVQSKFDSMGTHRLLHPPYSPDIVPCDFRLFGCLKMKLEGMFFETPSALGAEVEEIPGDSSITEWLKVFDECKDRLKQCIDAEDESL